MSALSISSTSRTGRLVSLEGFPEFALFDVIGYIAGAVIAHLAVAKARDSIIFVQALMSLGGGFYVPLDQVRTERLGHFDCQTRFYPCRVHP